MERKKRKEAIFLIFFLQSSQCRTYNKLSSCCNQETVLESYTRISLSFVTADFEVVNLCTATPNPFIPYSTKRD